MILVKGTRRLIATVTAFTVAHSITLAGATLGLVHVPQKPVEACIALSIVFVASEIVHAHQGWQGWTERWPWIVALNLRPVARIRFRRRLECSRLPLKQRFQWPCYFSTWASRLRQLLFIAAILSIMALGRWLIRHTAIPKPAWLARGPVTASAAWRPSG